jgi:hypothetical protein
MALRPQLFGMACFALVLLLTDRRREHRTALWLAALVVAVWANLHGSFFLGPLILGLAWIQDVHDGAPRARATLLVALVSVAAACLTPFGPTVWLYAVGLSLDPSVTARISEWQPTSLRNPAGLVFFASLAGTVVLIARRAAVVDWPTLAWLGAFSAVGIYAERGIAWWALAAVPPVASMLPRPTAPQPRPDSVVIRRANAALVALLVASGVVLLPWWRPVDPGTDAPVLLLTDAPSGITEALREQATRDDRIFNHQAWGSWLTYAIPQATIAIDSRIELYPPEVWNQYEGVMAGVDGWQAQVDQWGVTIVVLDADATATTERFISSGWTRIHEDGDGVILGRP